LWAEVDVGGEVCAVDTGEGVAQGWPFDVDGADDDAGGLVSGGREKARLGEPVLHEAAVGEEAIANGESMQAEALDGFMIAAADGSTIGKHEVNFGTSHC
jgi:CubicO group peptidase (beta-lactamase class C family)